MDLRTVERAGLIGRTILIYRRGDKVGCMARGTTGTVTQLGVGLVWLGTTMYAAHATITGGVEVSGALGAATAALPGVVAAALVTGASIGAATGPRYRSAGGRLPAGLTLGALFGLAAAAGIRFAYGGETSIVALAVTVGAASVIGGGLPGLPH